MWAFPGVTSVAKMATILSGASFDTVLEILGDVVRIPALLPPPAASRCSRCARRRNGGAARRPISRNAPTRPRRPRPRKRKPPTHRVQRQIRRPPQARRRLRLFRFHAGPQLRYRRSRTRRRKNRSRSTSNIPCSWSRSGAAGSPPPSRHNSNCCSRPPCAPKRCRCRSRRRTRTPAAAPAAAAETKPRAKPDPCARHAFSCEWPRLSESIKDLKKLFTPPRTSRSGAEFLGPSVRGGYSHYLIAGRCEASSSESIALRVPFAR